MIKVGVLALQGAFREHCEALRRCGVEAVEIRKADELDDVSGLILPGGESTTIGKLLTDWGIMDKIKARAAQGMAIYGTCAGLILLAKTIVNSDQPRLGLMDITVQRNAFGRQVDSFEADLAVPELGSGPFHAVFIGISVFPRNCRSFRDAVRRGRIRAEPGGNASGYAAGKRGGGGRCWYRCVPLCY